MKKIIACTLLIAIMVTISGCAIVSLYDSGSDVNAQIRVADEMAKSQKTPTDISYSLERYNLIRRAYWVNGQREKANALVCSVEKPLGYIVLFNGSTIVGRFVVDGKVTSLNSYLTPDSEYYEINTQNTHYNEWLADVDGSYGENDNGIFFFTPNGNYIEWTGEYLYSDIPIEVDNPVITYETAGE